jgi:hypothetical protein
VAPSATSGQSTATCTTTYTKAETGNFTANYGGDSNYAVSGNTIGQTIAKSGSTTTIAESSSTVVTGQTVVFTATVKPVSGNVVTPTGTVAFSEVGSGSTFPSSCNSVALASNGTATCSIQFGVDAPSSVFPTTIHAAYSGDSNVSPSADSTDATVSGPVGTASTRVFVNSSANPAVSGQALTITAQVAPVAPGGGSPPGTVTFSSGVSGFTCTNTGGVTQTVSGGLASCSVPAGVFTASSGISVSAAYSGNPSTPTYGASSGTLTQAEQQDTTSITLIVNPKRAHINSPLSLTAVVLNPPPGSGAITGLVNFVIVGKHSGPLNCAPGTGLTNNSASLTPTSGNEVTCNLSSLPATANPLKVSVDYFGDSNYTGSTVSKKIHLH